MKRLFRVVIGLAVIFGLTGCGGDYAAEKEMWHSLRAAKEVLANAEATPPGQFELIANRFRKIIKKYPRWPGAPKARWTILELYIAQKDYAKAEAELKKVIDENRDNKELCAQVEATRGSIYETQKNWRKALRVYDRLMKTYPHTVQGLTMPFYIANRYRSLEDFPGAAGAYLKAKKKYESIKQSSAPDNVKALAEGLNIKTRFALATLYAQQDRWPEALPLLKKIISDYPHSRDGLGIPLYIANYYKSKGDELQAGKAFDEALGHYEGIYRKNRESPLGMVALTLISTGYMNQKKWTEVIKTQEKIIKEYPASPGIPLNRLNIAVLYDRELKDNDKAIAAYQKLIEQHPRHRLAQMAEQRKKALAKLDSEDTPQ